MYKPPFSITNQMLTKSISIAEKIGRIDSFRSLKRLPILRRNNKIKSVHSSLAIEANSLSLDEVRAVLDGKTVVGPQKEIQEVKNAFKAYDSINDYNPFSETDLLKAHGLLTYLTCDESGVYRNHAEGVFDGDRVIFVAPPADMVPVLMNGLFNWLRTDTQTPMLVKSCVFHYEFVFIHPFADGNGRTARLWQNVLLTNWKPVFQYIPIESAIKSYQSTYYEKISFCHKAGNSNAFVEFMLDLIDITVDEILVGMEREAKNVSESVTALLEVMEYDIPYSANELMSLLKIKSKETLRATYLNPAIENGLVKMTIPDKPKSKNQKYFK